MNPLSDQSASAALVEFLRYIADPSRPFDHDRFDSALADARALGYVSVQSKGQIMLTPYGLKRVKLALDEDRDA